MSMEVALSLAFAWNWMIVDVVVDVFSFFFFFFAFWCALTKECTLPGGEKNDEDFSLVVAKVLRDATILNCEFQVYENHKRELTKRNRFYNLSGEPIQPSNSNDGSIFFCISRDDINRQSHRSQNHSIVRKEESCRRWIMGRSGMRCSSFLENSFDRIKFCLFLLHAGIHHLPIG